MSAADRERSQAVVEAAGAADARHFRPASSECACGTSGQLASALPRLYPLTHRPARCGRPGWALLARNWPTGSAGSRPEFADRGRHVAAELAEQAAEARRSRG
ncbi:hypothetical protein HBB16_12945 [Pseudonocardia sp. MCCB 268]|nr:hypothetical protein [Pseudonocardia cytotoxica]